MTKITKSMIYNSAHPPSGLIYDDVDLTDEETNINLLFNMALERIAFLPFGYLVDKFRQGRHHFYVVLLFMDGCECRLRY
jgi:glycopeptide antibiotics resistance protein